MKRVFSILGITILVLILIFIVLLLVKLFVFDRVIDESDMRNPAYVIASDNATIAEPTAEGATQ